MAVAWKIPDDATTEIIAHFIGHFELLVEAGRLRPEFPAFDIEREAAELALRPPLPAIDPPPQHELRGHEGAVDYEAPLVASRPPDTPTLAAVEPVELVAAPTVAPLRASLAGPPRAADAALGARAGEEAAALVMPIPSAIATLTLQSNRLSDDDLLIVGGEADFVPLAPLHAELDTAKTLGDLLVKTVLGDAAGAPLATSDFTEALVDGLDQTEPPPIAGLEATLIRGAEARGVVADGIAAETLPEWEDELPAVLRDDPPESTSGEAAAAARDGGTALQATPGDAVAGEPVANAVGADAPAPGSASAAAAPDPFARMPVGDAASSTPAGPAAGHAVVTGANQAINDAAIAWRWLDAKVFAVEGDVVDLDVVVQHNLLRDRDGGGADEHVAASTAVNAAQLPTADEPVATPASPPSSPVPPAVAELLRIPGDITLVNSVQQHNFVTDTDRVETALSGSNSNVVTGQNVVFNEALLSEYGHLFDMIVVGGNLTKIDLVNQLNVLLDDDDLDPAMGGGAARAATGGDNLLMNRAVLEQRGRDVQVELEEAFADAANALKGGMEKLSREVVEHPLFAGLETLRALYVDGDFTVMNVIDQRTYMGDQDQVHLVPDGVAEATGVGAEPIAPAVTAGSNAMLNAARIVEEGIDSLVMARGQSYTDAVLYQAGLVDTDAQPTGVQLPALVNEALAFLADELVSPVAVDQPEPPAFDHGDVGTVDVLQTMLA